MVHVHSTKFGSGVRGLGFKVWTLVLGHFTCRNCLKVHPTHIRPACFGPDLGQYMSHSLNSQYPP